MSRQCLRHLCAPFFACVLVLLAYACQDHGKPHHRVQQAAKQSEAPEHPPEAAKQTEGPAAQVLQGACSQADRTEYVHDPNLKFINEVRACGKETWANKGENIACIAKVMPSLSKGCAGCFADTASCALANCKIACMFSSTSERCTNCANSNCQASLITCTGVARADLP